MLNFFYKNILIFFLASIITACGGDSTTTVTPIVVLPPPPPPVEISPAETLSNDLTGLSLSEFYEFSLKALALRDPEYIVNSGRENEYQLRTITLTNISEKYLDETNEMLTTIIELANSFDITELTANEKISYDVFHWHITDSIENNKYRYHDFATKKAISSYYFFMQFPLNNENDTNHFLLQLRNLEKKLVQVENNLNTAAKLGVIENALTLSYRKENIDYFANTTAQEHPLYEHFNTALSANPDISVVKRNSQLLTLENILTNNVIPAFNNLSLIVAQQLEQAPKDIGVGHTYQGAEYYQQRLAHHTSTKLTAEDIHQLGIKRLTDIHQQIKQAFIQLGYPDDESLEQGYARVKIDGGTVSAEDSLALYQHYVDTATSDSLNFFNKLPTTPLKITYGGGGYLPAPTDGSDSAYYLAPIDEEQPIYLIPTLTYHEAVPGHHYQLAMAQEANLPSFRKNLHFTGLIEGWALYSERLAFEQGWYENDIYGNLGRLQYEAMRAARLVVDTGIHAKGWTFEQALQYYMDVTGYVREEAENHIVRYAVNVGQATAYMIGMLKIMELRQQAIDTKGDNFNLAAFHDVIINNGAMPLDTLSVVVNNWLTK
ncbi:MAG: hypothetical protein ACI9LM_001025 [Alteromonadaceae bacterium]|jgi:uncharacterized protein (DUF885 family)